MQIDSQKKSMRIKVKQPDNEKSVSKSFDCYEDIEFSLRKRSKSVTLPKSKTLINYIKTLKEKVLQDKIEMLKDSQTDIIKRLRIGKDIGIIKEEELQTILKEIIEHRELTKDMNQMDQFHENMSEEQYHENWTQFQIINELLQNTR